MVRVLDLLTLIEWVVLIPTFPTVTVVVFVLLCEPLLNAEALAFPDEVEVELDPELDPELEVELPEPGGGGAAWETIGKARNETTVAAASTFFIFMADTSLMDG